MCERNEREGQALFVNKKHQKSFWCFYKQGYQDSNLEMTESESVALPFGDSPSTDIDYTRYSFIWQVFFLNFSKNFEKPESRAQWALLSI